VNKPIGSRNPATPHLQVVKGSRDLLLKLVDRC